jgi:cell division protein FtsL
MSRDNRNRRKFSLSQKIFYVLSFLIILSMVLSLVAVAITGDAGF